MRRFWLAAIFGLIACLLLLARPAVGRDQPTLRVTNVHEADMGVGRARCPMCFKSHPPSERCQ